MDVRVGSKLGHIGPKWDKSGTVKDNFDPLVQQLDKRHFWSYEISRIENFDDIYSDLLTLSITLRSLKLDIM